MDTDWKVAFADLARREVVVRILMEHLDTSDPQIKRRFGGRHLKSAVETRINLYASCICQQDALPLGTPTFLDALYQGTYPLPDDRGFDHIALSAITYTHPDELTYRCACIIDYWRGSDQYRLWSPTDSIQSIVVVERDIKGESRIVSACNTLAMVQFRAALERLMVESNLTIKSEGRMLLYDRARAAFHKMMAPLLSISGVAM